MRNPKEYPFHPRWKMTLKLRTSSPLHIGSGEVTYRDGLKVKGDEGRKAEISACLKDKNGLPYIPGSTIKGVLRQWLEQHLLGEASAIRLCHCLLGHGTGNDANPKELHFGGTAEFWAGTFNQEETIEFTTKNAPPYWDSMTQTYVETGIAVDRVRRTAADQKLFYQEQVPAGAGFTLTVCGAMCREQAALLAAALQRGFTAAQPITFGGDESNGGGRMQFECLDIACLDKEEVAQWLTEPEQHKGMAAKAMRLWSPEECDALIAEGSKYLKQTNKAPRVVTINLRFDGPFLVNDPPRCKKKDDDSSVNHFPLQDKEGKPILPARSLRGALRSQAEKIIRTLGAKCCDPAAPCPPLDNASAYQEKLCPVCQLFGATGWKSKLKIRKIAFVESHEKQLLPQQDFVAIDRFHGGSRDTAKFNASFFDCPAFTITLELAPGMNKQAKGLLALVLRDLQEGDISLGFGRSKGYGKILVEEKKTMIPNMDFLAKEENLTALRELCTANQQPISCLSREIPKPTGTRNLPKNQPPQATAPTFHNPYHFIPVSAPKTATWLATKDFGENMHDSHALYRDQDESKKKILHGRIKCSITSETPLFIGGKQHEGEPKPIDPFEIDGQPAIPATSLRGMLSSLAEAASNSALRVLDGDKMLSRRMTMQGRESLSAMGMLLQTKNGLRLLPLSLPDLPCDQNGRLTHPVPDQWREIFHVPGLKVYINGYVAKNKQLDYARPSFIDKIRPRSFSSNNTEFWYMKLGQNTWVGSGLNIQKPHKKIINTRRGPVYYLLGQQALMNSDEGPISQEDFDNDDLVPASEKATYTKGVLRVLGIDGREDDMPTGKYHEIFLPLPADCMKNKTLEIGEALERFHRLADERAEVDEKYPFEPVGKIRDQVKGISTVRLKSRDIVFFKLDEEGKVAELALSSIWRKEIPATISDYFSAIGENSAELLPFNETRKYISPAELLFGFVQEKKDEEQEKGKEQFAFASKILVSPARLQEGQEAAFLEEVTLKILSSPKLPSPALYFDKPGYVAKHEMNNNSSIKPQGRKQYLHALRNRQDEQGVQKNGGLYPWKSRNEDDFKNQKVRIRPLQKGVRFQFSLDFDNCTEWELGLLLYVLQPTAEYRHKIGMGKPLGLGSIKIEIEGVELIDRRKRYAQDSLDAARYNHAEQPDQERLQKLRACFAESMEPEIRHAIELLGNPAHVVAPVHYPQVHGADIEKENFKWFVANDKKDPRDAEHLVPLSQCRDSLPTLQRHRE